MRRPHLRHDHLAAGVAVALAAAAACFAAPATAAPSVGIFLPQPTAQLTTEPPLLARVQPLERRFPGRLRSRLRVTVDLDPDGRPVALRADQRLTISALGDYFFVVPAPAVSVSAAPGSAVAPGRRRQGIVWQGFSPGRRTLAARVRLRTAAAALLLPLRVRVVRGGLRITNATAVPVLAYDAAVARAEIDPVLRELRRAVARDELPRPASIQVPGTPRTVRIRAEAVFAVRGTLRFGRRRVRFAGRLGPGAKRALDVRTKMRVLPTVELVARPVLPRELVRTGTRRRGGASLLALAYRAYFAIARGQQYARFLANPDPAGPASATFVYRSAPAAPSSIHHFYRAGGGTSALTIVVLALVALLALGGLVVLWAHL
jgi:hypothetical protein